MDVYAILIAAALVTVTAPAQDRSVEDAVQAVEQRFEDALEQRNRGALEEVLAEPFTWVHASDARIDTRAVFLENAGAGLGLSRQRTESSTFGRTLAVHGDTAITTARVRLRFPGGAREVWLTQSRVYVRRNGRWQVAMGQGTRMYDGPPTRTELYSRYSGTFVLGDGRTLNLAWDGDALMATLPTGARTQVFLASPTEEAVATIERLNFDLDANGRPAAVRLMRRAEQLWRAERRP